MDIGVNKAGEWTLDAQAMQAMITGKLKWKRCFSCDEGSVWIDSDEGVVCNQSFVEENQDIDNTRFHRDVCEDCMGVGFLFVG